MTKNNLNLQWKTSESNKDTVLFYYFPENTIERIEEFKKRINSVEYKKCYINISLDHNAKIISLNNDDWFETQKKYCDELYPLSNNPIFGITGTNGKTTTTDIFRQLLNIKSKKVLTIGTLGVWLNEIKVNDFNLTTPNYIDLRKSLFENKYDFAVIEASSHALDQNRFNGIIFDSSVWTSFSQDHLDYHKSMDEYFKAKKKIINSTKQNLFISLEDKSIINKLDPKVIKTCSLFEGNLCDYFSVSYNRKNLSLVISVLKEYGISFTIKEIQQLNPTAGRFNILKKENCKVVIDFAHTPDALENIGNELRKEKRRIISVMGCGGDRDRSKRPLMAEACSNFSDFIYLTSDNPRTEDPFQILKDIEVGVKATDYLVIEDRAKAIRSAIENNRDSIILIAGKGHEEYIDKNGKKEFFSDKEEVLKAFDDLF